MTIMPGLYVPFISASTYIYQLLIYYLLSVLSCYNLKSNRLLVPINQQHVRGSYWRNVACLLSILIQLFFSKKSISIILFVYLLHCLHARAGIRVTSLVYPCMPTRSVEQIPTCATLPSKLSRISYHADR